jgi:hypothetical protein
MSKTRRSTSANTKRAPRKRNPHAIEDSLRRDKRRQQAELLERYEARPVFPDPESERYKP